MKRRFILKDYETIIKACLTGRRIQMPTDQRIKISLLLEKMHGQQEFSQRLGIEDVSTFHRKRIVKEEEKKSC